MGREPIEICHSGGGSSAMEGRRFGERYRLVRGIGHGGMGEVWAARDERLGRDVAVKVVSMLAEPGGRGDAVRARFLREARITAALQHPNIVTVHDMGEAGTEVGQVPFLVMELVPGESLDTVLRRGRVALADAAKWGAQISEALAAAHEAAVLHRDIKPANVLVTPSGLVKVLDFGIARAAGPYATADRLTEPGFIVGTPPYMAPEQARGLPETRSDLYALGCLLFELVTGRLPFTATDSMGYVTAHLTQTPPTPSSVAPGIPAAWDRVLLRLLSKEPERRYSGAAELAVVLRGLSAGQAAGEQGGKQAAVQAEKQPVAQATRQPVATPQSKKRAVERARKLRRNRRWASAGKAVLVVAGVWSGWALNHQPSTDSKAKSACSQSFEDIKALYAAYPLLSDSAMRSDTAMTVAAQQLGANLRARSTGMSASSDPRSVSGQVKITLGNVGEVYRAGGRNDGLRRQYYQSLVAACHEVSATPPAGLDVPV
ncbi:serine/threonine-protein kinase [Streptomyces sp. NPDC050738]|uniref:serine/threonine-protein kinase n=1 Tax=Streptomyces sp. NPDC050738 TaxID=3154744 RepID=UPI003435AF92